MLIQNVIDSQFVGNHFNAMIWYVLHVPSSHGVLTSDRPIIMSNGLGKPDSHLALPIGPQTLFIAANSNAIADAIVKRDSEQLARFSNDRVVCQARRFVIGIDDRQLRFVAKRFGTRLPSSPTETKRMPSPEELRSSRARTMRQK